MHDRGGNYSRGGDSRAGDGVTATTADIALDVVRRRDELLTMLYWLRADGLNEAPTALELAPFAGADSGSPLEADLEWLVAAGFAEAPASASGPGQQRFQLTHTGLTEGKRRFTDEFNTLPDDGTAGNTHEVMLGICGPNAKCVKAGLHDECDEPVVVWPQA